jgi:hypothetical protein
MGDFKIVKLVDPITVTSVTGGLVPRGSFSSATTYNVGDEVSYSGSSYVLYAAATAGTLPTDTTKWSVLASKGDTGATGPTGPAGSGSTDTTKLYNFGATVTKTADFSALANNRYSVDATAGNITANLPASGTQGYVIFIQKSDSTTNIVNMSGNINGNSGSTLPLRTQLQGKLLEWDGTSTWNVIAGDLSLPALDARYVSTTGAVTSVAGRTGAVVLAESDITNLTTDLAAKAALASPTFTGTPAAPTATAGTNTTQLATTAFVTSAISAATPADATTSSKGVIQLAGDLGGTAAAPTNLQFTDVTDSTKKGVLSLANATTGTTQTYVLPGVGTTLVGTAGAQTISGNKTFSGTTTIGTTTVTDATNITFGTTTGTQIGTSTTQKIGFFGTTPAAQQVATNDLGTVLANFGLRASGQTYILSTSGTATFSGAFSTPVTPTRTANTTVTITTGSFNPCDATTASFAVTLPAASGRNGQIFTFKKIDSSANTVTITRGSTDTIDGATTYVLSAQWKYVTIVSNGSNGWYIQANN